jgi:hypothetical protein
MTVIATSTTWIVPPGKDLEFIEMNSRAKKIHMRLGAENAVLGRIQIGENTGQYVYQLYFASAAAYGKFMDSVGTDKEWITMYAEGVKKQVATLGMSRLLVGIDI